MTATALTTHRVRLLAVGAVILVAAVATIAIAASMAGDGYESGGPLASTLEAELTTHAEPGGSVTWGVVLPPNKGASDVVLESIEPAEPISGLTVLGTGVNDPAVFPVGSAAGYPQPGLVLQDVKGAVLAPDNAAQPRLQVVYGLRLDAAPGHLPGLRIRYATGGHRYETVFNAGVVVELPDP